MGHQLHYRLIILRRGHPFFWRFICRRSVLGLWRLSKDSYRAKRSSRNWMLQIYSMTRKLSCLTKTFLSIAMLPKSDKVILFWKRRQLIFNWSLDKIKIILKSWIKFVNIFTVSGNLVDNQKYQAGFRQLCNKILFLGNKKSSSNQNVWCDHATMQQDVLLHFWVIFLYWNQTEIWKIILLSSSRAFSLSTPMENSAVCQV